eukprot:TRINITY_DN41012_c0_g1_i1.p1 TRINITY_DN41012_c0_g1~~TRINITY_DN41012_c0_g1_i1.p1  ORF type:complete len:101 (+),score=32.49 TRINITY_DN41012_c0_g1_i1:58-360(+)
MVFFFQAEDGIRDAQESRGLGDVYKRQDQESVDWSDPWSVLHLDPQGGHLTAQTLQRAFREQLLVWHPDHNPGNEQLATDRTQIILNAYQTLKQSTRDRD